MRYLKSAPRSAIAARRYAAGGVAVNACNLWLLVTQGLTVRRILVFFESVRLRREPPTQTHNSKNRIRGANWEMPPPNCLPTTRPSRPTTPRRGPTAVRRGRPRAGPHRPHHTPSTHPLAVRPHAPPHPTTTAHTVPNSSQSARFAPLPPSEPS